MQIVVPKVIAPDTSHWNSWIDAGTSNNLDERNNATLFYDQLIESGRIPLLSWHHLEEMLSIENEGKALSRVKYIQTLPFIAWMRLAESPIPGGITDILAAEAMAFTNGHKSLVDIRDNVRTLTFQTGPATDALGEDILVWKIVRRQMLEGKHSQKMIPPLMDYKPFDDDRTIGEISKEKIRDEKSALGIIFQNRNQLQEKFFQHNKKTGYFEAGDMADGFTNRVLEKMPQPDESVRDLLSRSLMSMGLEIDEIRDDSKLSELMELGVFRKQLLAVTDGTGITKSDLKKIPLNALPSRLIDRALKLYGQKRVDRPGSDLVDRYLATLAAYVDIVYTDKRTSEDLKRVLHKEKKLNELFGEVKKASNYLGLLEA